VFNKNGNVINKLRGILKPLHSQRLVCVGMNPVVAVLITLVDRGLICLVMGFMFCNIPKL
jgi:hypothetical protein